jgi:pimeloyl-ACP methyl ester carboxylesterase
VTDAKGLLPGFEERYADVKAVRVRYYAGGPANGQESPLVLIHGLGGAASNWTELAPRLARTRRVLVPDLPGHGGSAALPAAPTLMPYADRVGRLMAQEEMAPAVVVGHSLGALVALRLALLQPAAVRGIVLAAAGGISSTTRRARYALAILGVVKPGRWLAPYRARIARSTFLRSLVFGYWGASDVLSLSGSAVEGFMAGPALHTDTVSAARALVADDPRAELAGVTCPCLVLWGSEDHQVEIGDAFEYARRLRAELRVIAGCGHLLIGERPDVCFDAIEEFSASISGTR